MKRIPSKNKCTMRFIKTMLKTIVFSLPIYEFEKLTQHRYDSFRGVKLKTFSAPIRIRGGF